MSRRSDDRKLNRFMLCLVLTLIGLMCVTYCPSCNVLAPETPVAEMSEAEFDVYLAEVQYEAWDLAANVYLVKYPGHADELLEVADLLMEASEKRLGIAASSWLEVEARERGIDPALSYAVRKIVRSVARRVPVGEGGRWVDVMGVVGAGLRLAAALQPLEEPPPGG